MPAFIGCKNSQNSSLLANYHNKIKGFEFIAKVNFCLFPKLYSVFLLPQCAVSYQALGGILRYIHHRLF